MYFLKKISYSLLTIFLAVTAIFFVLRMAPGDPVQKILGDDATIEEVQVLRIELGLNKPVFSQYLTFLSKATQGDLGKSLFKKKSVISLMKKHFHPTFIIAFVSIFISSIIGILYGVIAAYNKSGLSDNLIRIFSLVALSFPIFSLAPVLVYIFSIKLRLLPVSEWSSLSHMVLPILTLVIPLSSVIIRVMRNKFLEERNSPWVVVLKAKGMHPISLIFRVTRVCMPTIMNVIAIQLSVVLAGTMITETIFDIPGMGMLLFDGIQNRDYPIVQGIIVYSTVIYMMVYFFVDFLNEKIDPRIRALNV